MSSTLKKSTTDKTAEVRGWANFDEYQDYQIGIFSEQSRAYSEPQDAKDDNYDKDDRDDKDDKDEDYEEDEDLTDEDLSSIIKNVPNSFFNNFWKIVYDKPWYIDSNINAHLHGNLTVSLIKNNNKDIDMIDEVFNMIVSILKKDRRFHVMKYTNFYKMDVLFEDTPYKEKFSINLFLDKKNNYNVLIEMRGIKKDNICNLFFFYEISNALKSFYEVRSYNTEIDLKHYLSKGDVPPEEVGIDYLPSRYCRNISLTF